MRKRSLSERFWSKVHRTSTCWLWTGCIKPSGHGQIQRGSRGEGAVNAHIVAYELMIGPLPEGMVLHHLCAVKACVNPAHLQVLTRAEHPRVHKRTVCRNGLHAMTPDNIVITTTVKKDVGQVSYRSCVACLDARRRRAAA